MISKLLFCIEIDGFALNAEKVHLEYFGRNDILGYASVSRQNEKFKPITSDFIYSALNTEFQKDSFSKYHQEIIDRGIGENKELILTDEYVPTTSGNFEIKDEGKQLVLTKTKQKGIR